MTRSTKERFSRAPTHPNLTPSDLRLRVEPQLIPDGQPLVNGAPVVAQDAALAALEMGLAINSPGYNVFVSGPAGTGKMSTVLALLRQRSGIDDKIPGDLVYVHNFKDADRPRLIRFEAGQGVCFRRAIDEFVDLLRREIPRVFDDEAFNSRRDALMSSFEEEQRTLIEDFEKEAQDRGFAVERVAVGSIARPDLLVTLGDEVCSFEEVEQRIEAGKGDGRTIEEIAVDYERLRGDFDAVMRLLRQVGREVDGRLMALERSECLRVIDGLLEDLQVQFPSDDVVDWLDQVQDRVIERLDLFAGSEPVPRGEGEEGEEPPAEVDPGWARPSDDPFREFRINVVLDNSQTTGRPVVVERNPTFQNLFGTIERGHDDPAHTPVDFKGIRGGAVLQADGGFLVLDAAEAFSEPGVWRALRRTLKYGSLEIQPSPEGTMMPCSLKPDPVDVSVKVVVTGDHDLYYELYMNDEDFSSTFKVKAEFDSEIAFEPGGITRYSTFVRKVCDDEGLPAFSREAIAKLVEEGLRVAESRTRLSASFSRVADWVRESAFVAVGLGCDTVEEEHVDAALVARLARHDLVERLTREDIYGGVIVIDTKGERVGAINALTVFDYGDHVHAVPCRISAVVGAGRQGVVSVEREALLSGRIHAKSIFVLAGFLLERFGQRRPLSLYASTVFEQSYSLLDGDSASSAETYALLSALSEVPLRQGIAATGSVTQRGAVMAVGGINEKIEGFFDICEEDGLTGDQGVVLPTGNLGHLMLDSRVVDSVRQGRFHIWAVDDVNTGLEILTGVCAGQLRADGTYPPGTINALVAARLEELANAAVEDLGRATE